MNAHLSRRAFLGTSAASVGALALLPASARPLGANGDIRLAVAGLNGRGAAHVKEFGHIPGVRITHLIDPDTRTFAKRQQQLRDLKQQEAATAQDVRTVLDSKDVDAISIATPNHWHSLMTIWGCQAGKDVYCEKPCSHNLHEGSVAVAAAKKYGRIVQHGTQRRSQASWWKLRDLVKSGTYGKLLVSRAICYKLRTSIGNKPTAAAPSEVDFNLWQGPAADRPFHANLVHYNWHWFWDFGNGDVGNQGVHHLDVARWMIPGADWPKSAVSVGGRLGYTDQGETPNTQVAFYDYGETQVVIEVRGLPTQKYYEIKESDNTLEFEAGIVSNGKFFPKGGTAGEPLPKVPADGAGPEGGIFQNFVRCVRSRKGDELHAGIGEGHVSSGLCHLANISYRLGEPGEVTPKACNGSPAAAETLGRLAEHFDKQKIDVSKTPLRVGKVVRFDGERFDDAAANALMSRAYRAPFVVPQI